MILILILFLVATNPVRAEEVLPAPSIEEVSFNNPAWQMSPENKIEKTGDGVIMNCSHNSGAIMILNLEKSYQGELEYEVKEEATNPVDLNYFLSVRNVLGTTNLNSIDVGLKLDRMDYENKPIGQDHFFYSTKSENGLMTPIDTYAHRISKGNANIISLNVTPAGAFARVNKINLAYLPSNKDQVGAVKIFYPVDYEFNKFNQIVIACPWTGLNKADVAKVIIKNPKIRPIVAQPDRKTVLETVAKKLLETMPKLPTGDPAEISDTARMPGNQVCLGIGSANSIENYYKSTIGGNDRINMIRVMALAYLYPKSEETYQKIKNDLMSITSDNFISDKGLTSGPLALAYKMVIKKYPDKKSEIDPLILPKLEKTVKYHYGRGATEGIPASGYMGRSWGGMNIYRAEEFFMIGKLFGNQDWINKGNCMLFHSATKNLSEVPNPPIPGCNYQTKVLFNGSEASDPNSDYNKALTYVESMTPTDGRYDTHGYGPNPAYMYGSSLGELTQMAILDGVNVKKQFTNPYQIHLIDAMWKQGLSVLDTKRNLSNSTGIGVYKPKNLSVQPPDSAYDNRMYCLLKKTNFENIFQKTSKSENFVDIASSIDGLLVGSFYYNDYTKFDELIRFIWYIGNDYALVPYDYAMGVAPYLKAADNLRPELYANNEANAFNYSVLPMTSIQRYVQAAMLLDPTLNLTDSDPIVTAVPKVAGDASGDGKVNMADFIIWRREFLTQVGTKSNFNDDGKVTLADFGIWRREFLKGLL